MLSYTHVTSAVRELSIGQLLHAVIAKPDVFCEQYCNIATQYQCVSCSEEFAINCKHARVRIGAQVGSV